MDEKTVRNENSTKLANNPHNFTVSICRLVQ